MNRITLSIALVGFIVGLLVNALVIWPLALEQDKYDYEYKGIVSLPIAKAINLTSNHNYSEVSILETNSSNGTALVRYDFIESKKFGKEFNLEGSKTNIKDYGSLTIKVMGLLLFIPLMFPPRFVTRGFYEPEEKVNE